MKKILVVDHGLDYGKPLKDMGDLTIDVVEFTDSPEKYDLVLFTGGSDVDPSYYNETSPKNYCSSSPPRDEKEAQIWSHAVENNVKCIGICRGLQFLNVMNGGRMMHHINGHSNGRLHDFETSKDGYLISVNSLHHQMIIPPKECFVIGWCATRESKVYLGDRDEVVQWPGPEIEAAYYPKTGCAGVQYHPEMMDPVSGGYKWFRELANDLVLMTTKDFTTKYVRGFNVIHRTTTL